VGKRDRQQEKKKNCHWEREIKREGWKREKDKHREGGKERQTTRKKVEQKDGFIYMKRERRKRERKKYRKKTDDKKRGRIERSLEGKRETEAEQRQTEKGRIRVKGREGKRNKQTTRERRKGEK
jgi:hypothetical protein